LTSWRSECNSQKMLEICSVTMKQQWIYAQY
jgi:hypothetical protein